MGYMDIIDYQERIKHAFKQKNAKEKSKILGLCVDGMKDQ